MKTYQLLIHGKHGRVEIFPVGSSNLPNVVEAQAHFESVPFSQRARIEPKVQFEIFQAMQVNIPEPVIVESLKLGTLIGRNLKTRFMLPESRAPKLIIDI